MSSSIEKGPALTDPSKAAAPEALVPKNNISVDSKLGV